MVLQVGQKGEHSSEVGIMVVSPGLAWMQNKDTIKLRAPGRRGDAERLAVPG